MSVSTTVKRSVTGCEHAAILGDHHDRPGCFFVRVHARGQLETQPFEEALTSGLEMFPALSSVLQGKPKDPTNKLKWTSVHKVHPYLHWGTLNTGWKYPGRQSFVLHDELGVRLWVRQGEGKVAIQGQFHQAVVQPIQAIAFLEWVLFFYDQILSKGPQSSELYSPRALEEKSHALGNAESFPGALKAFFRRRKLARAQAHSFKAARKTEGAKPSFPSYVMHDCTETEWLQWRELAQLQKTSVDVLFVRDWLLALHRWSSAKRAGRHQPITLSWVEPAFGGPHDFRPEPDAKIRPANWSDKGIGPQKGQRLVRTWSRRALEDPNALLDDVKQWAGYDSARVCLDDWNLLVTDLGQRAPKRLRTLMGPNHCHSSANFVSVGEVMNQTGLARKRGKISPGGLRVDRVDLLPTLGYGTEFALGSVLYGGRWNFSLHHDSHIPDERAKALLSRLVERVGTTLRGEDTNTN